jgi:hypothetical protein
MDFQRLFKRKEEDPAPPIALDKTRVTLNERDVLVCEGELLDGKSPAPLVWSNVGGAISVKADKILGILEGRTRIKATALQELYPGLFEKAPNPGTEFNIPLQSVVLQLEDIFAGISSEEEAIEDFDTPFGELAREDEARFKDKPADRLEVRPIVAAQSFLPPQPGSKPVLKEEDRHAGLETLIDENSTQGPKVENFPTNRGNSGYDELLSNGEKFMFREPRKLQKESIRREGHEYLQELYLTDEPLDGSKVADLILKLPRVAGVVIMLSNGAALGGGLSGGLNEELLSLTPEFVQKLSGFTKSIQGGPVKFVTFSGRPRELSLTLGGEVLILAVHDGKNLPPGLRERLVATAHALNMIYGSQS